LAPTISFLQGWLQTPQGRAAATIRRTMGKILMQASQNALRTVPDAAERSAAPQTLSGRWNVKIEFRATGGEYFRIWIVNLLATLQAETATGDEIGDFFAIDFGL
jgi:hypothetical protein